jgi:serine/threonine protein kinase
MSKPVDKMTLRDLKQLAKSQGRIRYSKLKKSDLIHIVKSPVQKSMKKIRPSRKIPPSNLYKEFEEKRNLACLSNTPLPVFYDTYCKEDISSYHKKEGHITYSYSMSTIPSVGTHVVLTSHSNLVCTILKTIYDGRSAKVFLISIQHPTKQSIHILKISLRDHDDLQTEKDILNITGSYLFEKVNVKVHSSIYKGAVIQYCGMHLRDALKTCNVSTEDLFKKVINALDKLHNKCILHQDLKPMNILFNEFTKDITIIDFGYARVFKGNKPVKQCGFTIDYVSPYQSIQDICLKIPDYGYRKLDDILSIVYTFCDLEGKNPYKYVSNAMKEIDIQFVQKYKGRSEKAFSSFIPKNRLEKMYKVFFNSVSSKLGHYSNKYIWNNVTKNDKKRWIDGKMVDTILTSCIRATSLYYKSKEFRFKDIAYLYRFSKKFEKGMLYNIRYPEVVDSSIQDPIFTGLKK